MVRRPRTRRRSSFNLRRNVHFADGTPLTAADAVFSFRRLINLKGNPSFLLDGVTVSARGRYTVILRSKTPNAALPSILTNTSLGIVNSKLVRKHGGTAAVGADKNDKAEQWLNSAASRGAGSGPYLLQRYSTTSQITLVPNPRYWGSNKAAFKTVVVRNMIAPTQLINIQRGKHEVAIDLSADQAQTIKGNKRLNVRTQPSTWTFWLFANNNSDISSITPNKRFQAAVRYALDYRSIVRVAGPGSIQAPGIIPSMFLGSLPRKEAIKQNLDEGEERAGGFGGGQPDDHARVPERSDDQRRPVRLTRAAGSGEPAGGRLQHRARRRDRRHVAAEVSRREDGVRALALGPRLPGSTGLSGVHARRARRDACRLAGGLRADGREAGREGARNDERRRRARRSTGRSSAG